jgi:hypothetical protein
MLGFQLEDDPQVDRGSRVEGSLPLLMFHVAADAVLLMTRLLAHIQWL